MLVYEMRIFTVKCGLIKFVEGRVHSRTYAGDTDGLRTTNPGTIIAETITPGTPTS